jgi:flagellar biosynthesis protein FliR
MIWVLASLRPIAALTVIALVAAPVPRWLGAAAGASLGLFVTAVIRPDATALDALGVARELAIGAALGAVAAVPLVALGWSARLVDAGAGEPGARPVFLLVGAAVFAGIDGPALLAESIARSYRAVSAAGAIGGVVPAIAGLLAAAARLAVPFVVAAAIVEIAVGAVGRAMASPRVVGVLPWRRGAVVAIVAGGLVVIAVNVADGLRAAWAG